MTYNILSIIYEDILMRQKINICFFKIDCRSAEKIIVLSVVYFEDRH